MLSLTFIGLYQLSPCSKHVLPESAVTVSFVSSCLWRDEPTLSEQPVQTDRGSPALLEQCMCKLVLKI